VGRIVELLESHADGLRAEQIRDTLGLQAKELPRPIAEALDAKKITKVGEKRATTYFAGSGRRTAPVAKTGNAKGKTTKGKPGRPAKGKGKGSAESPKEG
jgi:hypothetical protein